MNKPRAHKIELVILKDYIDVEKFNELFNKIGDLVEEYVDTDVYSLQGAFDDSKPNNTEQKDEE